MPTIVSSVSTSAAWTTTNLWTIFLSVYHSYYLLYLIH
jgi:hypothetical protein